MTTATGAIRPASLACSTICFRNEELPQALRQIRQQGFDAIDLGALQGLCEHVPLFGSAEDMKNAGRIVHESGLEVLSVNADPGSFNDDVPSLEILDRIEALTVFCAEVRAPLLLLPCGSRERDDVPYRQQLEAVASGINAAAATSARYGVQVAVEAPHHYRLVNTLERVRDLIPLLDPAVGLVYDVSHIRAAGEDPAAAYAEFASRVVHIHLRDAETGDIRKVLGSGDVDFAEFHEASQRAGYSGRYVLELETHDSPFATKKDEVADALQRLDHVFRSPAKAVK
ncbi:putative 2-keto-myo-inositol dehydratase [Arthrobacter globiformis NBRC 12137]|uniref:Putative 2-keto-myo-inositol dehydratase n=1 Tax=Arthrobacter globiformis (strain ATCC 8010 / DSM 20124 / JCM 1332 / NBRC 12137 / NCIMB 8907 / NRRL B-2979 / 168) TaxID=1077972 RepID=H0QPP3_ARTG1|nr:sugar phosphate isomerase/epimerase [Arthrobacter globiformis]GAB14794.1 putative 2-keto-myo-inositol dehydratase [Arthrobacter globiformis NBRC 12137]